MSGEHRHPHDHDHAHHDHDHHDHAHHDHHHHHEHTVKKAPLARGAGAGKLLFFDAPSGAAGDMTIAALLDLGVPLAVIEDAVRALPIEGFHLHVGHAHRSGILAAKFDVHVDAPQPERTWSSIDAMLEGAKLDDEAKALARRVFRSLGEAEASVHGIAIEEVHFHEVGAVDALVDIVGASAALAYVGAEVVVSPLPMGRGFVNARHGILPLPAPATVACLRGAPTYGVDLDVELVTPTGAAILATVASSFARWPSFSPERIGYGAGTRELPDRPNVLRAVLGAPSSTATTKDATHVIVEANVDDMTGELAAHAIEALFAAGALDAWAQPITMKKGRPALTISALTPRAREADVAEAMLRETTTIGVRFSPVARVERPRREIVVATKFGDVRVKVSEGPFGAPQVKPEFDDCRARAAEHKVTAREVLAEALAAASRPQG